MEIVLYILIGVGAAYLIILIFFRTFLKTLIGLLIPRAKVSDHLPTIASFAALSGGSPFISKTRKLLALTFEDPDTKLSPLMKSNERNLALLDTLSKNGLRAALFVCGMRVEGEDGKELIASWDERGHTIANHSYHHHYYHANKVPYEVFAQDLIRGDNVIKKYKNYEKLFRYPYLKEGNTFEKRDKMRSYVKSKGYRFGSVTIDSSDWFIDRKMREFLYRNMNGNLSPYKGYFIQHVIDRSKYYYSLARKAIGKEIPHTLLLSHNLLNALFLDDLLNMLRRNGWTLVEPMYAYSDPIYDYLPQNLPAGESLVWGIARESGNFERILRYPAEDEVYEAPKMERLGL